MKYYILKDKTPVEATIEEWVEWSKDPNRRVAHGTGKITTNGINMGNISISTIFLGLDHQFGDGPPLLFETMIFGGPLDQECERCSTWEGAEQMHEKMVERLKSAVKDIRI